MASMQRLETSNLSSPDGGVHNAGGASHRSFGGGLEKSHSFREGHEGRAGAGGGGPMASHGEGLGLTSVLFLDSIGLPNAKSAVQVELRRAMSAASGVQGSEDPSLGNIQCKGLENCSAEELKRVKAGLAEGVHRARERARHLSEAVIRADRYQNSMQSRKRNRADGGGNDRGSHGGPGQRGGGAAAGHVTKGSGRGASSSGEGPSPGAQKGGEKSKSGAINKRMRTSLADARPEARVSNMSLQRSSGVQERERESPRAGGVVGSGVEEKERGGVGGSEGWEKTKMKGRRSATIKPDVPVVSMANGVADGEREQKGGGQVQRGGGDGRSRPSEGHGFRSGPVHGSMSVQKAESVVQANGSGVRGGSKLEAGDGAGQLVGKAERGGLPERERTNCKGGVKPVGRDEGRVASPGILPKVKGARAPRSNLVAGGNQSAQMGRSLSIADGREKASVTSPAKAQMPSGPTNRKRAVPSRSSSPPVQSWVGARPQKMQRARRINVMPPVSISVPAKEQSNGVEEVAAGFREGGAMCATPSSRSSLGSAGGGGSLAKRASGGQGVPSSKAQADRSKVFVGPVESEEYIEEGQKMKGRRRKLEDEDVERKASGASERAASVVLATGRGVMLGAGEESGAGDGVRRQGRTGRGPVTARVAAVTSPMEKADGASNPKSTRIARAIEPKSAGAGRPGPKSGVGDRKISSRPRRVLGNSSTEITGEEEDDREQLSRAVQQAVEFSGSACSNSYWKQVEPFFAYVTPDDLSYLQRQLGTVGGMGSVSAAKSPTTGDRVLDSDEAKNVKSSKEQSAKERSLRRGRSGGWYDKVFPLSQRLLSAIISVDDADRDSDSPMPPSSQSEMDYDRRDPEGESDVDNLKVESEWWSGGGMEGGYSEGSPMGGGQGGRVWGEDQDGDDIVAGNEGQQPGGVGWGNGAEDDGGDEEAGDGRQLGNGSMDWDEQWRRMSLGDRLVVELSSVGLLPVQAQPEHNEQEADDIGEEIRRLQSQLEEQVVRNKEQLCKLESAVVEKRAVEERAREKLAMDKFVELAYKKKTGGRSNKGAAAKGARAAALAFGKRVLTKVESYEAGHGCITDGALRDRLFCVPPSLVESTPDAAMDAVKDGGAVATTAERLAPLSGAGGAMVFSGGHRMEEMGRASFLGPAGAMDFMHLKDEAWASRELSVEDVSRYTSTRDVNALSSMGLGGIKGKRSERERDAKAKEGGAGARSGSSNAKGERKAKPKPRQKTGPLLKPIQGLVPRAADQQSAMGRSPSQSQSQAQAQAQGSGQGPGHGHGQGQGPGHGHGGYFMAPESHALRREEGMLPMLPVPQIEGEGQIDLSAIPLPGMEMISMDQGDDIGSWLDFGLEDPMQQTDGLSMGLDVPMDDLSGLMML